MSDHGQLQQEIPAYIAGRLEGDARRRVEDHLGSCPECSDLVREWKTIVAGLKEGGEQLFEPHPDSLVLMRFVKGDEGDADGRIARHVETCATCELEVDVWRDQRMNLARFRPSSTRSTLYRVASAAVAAGLVLGLGLGVLLRDTGTADWSGPVDLLTLDGSARGEDAIPVVSPDPSQPYVPLVLLPSVPTDAGADEGFRFVIVDVDGAEVWRDALTATGIRDRLEGSGVVTFLVPSTMLPPGTYTLIFESAEDGAERLFETRFRVE
ncbi:MAG: zf-HC2 domain-containing protein [Acidobacteriota bacterium]|nr:zf-HC2 domain-containing protein [Acidobacteriota bacterium]